MISQIHLKNFKCFESDTIQLRPATLLAGLNGMGKSSVLQSMLLLRQSFLDGLFPKTGLELNGSLVQLGTACDLLFEGASQDTMEIGISWTDNTMLSLGIEYHREADILNVTRSAGDGHLAGKTLFNDDFHYLRAERLGPRTANSLSDFQVRQHRQIGTSGEFAEHFLYLYGGEKVAGKELCHHESEPDDLLSQVQCWLDEISPGVKLHLTLHPEMDSVNLQYSFASTVHRSNEYRSSSVGFGMTYVLPVLIAVLSSKPGGLVLIENPEAHLHPQGQVRIGELLAKAASIGIQVVVETHSDHVLNGIRLAVHGGAVRASDVAFNFFSRYEDPDRAKAIVESPIIDEHGRLDRWPSGFFDEWERSLEQLLAPHNEA